jgi:putative membrane protein
MFRYHTMQPVPYAPGAGIAFGLVSCLFWILIVLLVIAAFRRFGHGHWHHDHAAHGHSEDPLQIAKARYAKGELTKKEYEDLKKDLA